jgi:DNA-binding transcriptional ArsR family regulator
MTTEQRHSHILEVESQLRNHDNNINILIRSGRSKLAILAALADTELQKILDAAMFDSKSVSQIIKDTGIPHTSVYRKTKWLLDERLLTVDKIEITEDGKKSSLLRTVLKSFNVKYEYKSLAIEAEQNFDTMKKVTEKFFSLDRD